jgi:hypothetical protein
MAAEMDRCARNRSILLSDSAHMEYAVCLSLGAAPLRYSAGQRIAKARGSQAPDTGMNPGKTIVRK